jgi:hypothetical protein
VQQDLALRIRGDDVLGSPVSRLLPPTMRFVAVASSFAATLRPHFRGQIFQAENT